MKNTKIYLIILSFSIFFSPPILASEFFNSDIFPTVHSISFNKDSVGFTASMENNQYSKLYDTFIYFIHDRKSKSTKEVNEKDFLSKFNDVHQIMNASSGVTNNGIKYKTTSVYCQNGDDESWMTGKRALTINDVPIDLKLLNKCDSISVVEIVNDNQLWIATYQVGGHGDYATDGIIVQELKGAKLISRINAIKDLFTGMYPDPYSKNMWAMSKGAAYEINSRFNVVSRHVMSHDFDIVTGQPHIVFSETYKKLNDFSVISRFFSPKTRKEFYNVVLEIPIHERSKFKLYDFFMYGGASYGEYPVSFQKLTPFFIDKLNDDSGYTANWRQLLCRIGGVKSKQYCKR